MDGSSEISNLSRAQELSLALSMVPPALLSVLGCSLIIVLVVKSHHVTPYKRILFAMSVCDILGSINFALQPFLIPADGPHPRRTAVGNDATCTMLAFLGQFTFATYFYSGLLSLHFVLTIRYGWSDRRFARRVEPLGHVVCLGYPALTALAGVILGFYGQQELGPGCWVNSYPDNCGDDASESGEHCWSNLIAWIVGGIPIAILFPTVIINNVLIYRHVRSTLQRSRKHSLTPDSQLQRTRAVAIQSFLYVAAFWTTSMFPFIVRLLEGEGFDADKEASIYWLLLLQSVWTPSTGTWNFLVYIRPRYLLCRQDFPIEARLWALRRALFGAVVVPRGADKRFIVPRRADQDVDEFHDQDSNTDKEMAIPPNTVPVSPAPPESPTASLSTDVPAPSRRFV